MVSKRVPCRCWSAGDSKSLACSQEKAALGFGRGFIIIQDSKFKIKLRLLFEGFD